MLAEWQPLRALSLTCQSINAVRGLEFSAFSFFNTENFKEQSLLQCGNSYFTLSDKNIISLSIHGQILIPMIVLESWCNSAFKTVPGSSI